ncbi:MAG: rhamnulokinase [Bacteroidales bacterium]|nr:rhamnulokinase [Bacteroidales bacterium]
MKNYLAIDIGAESGRGILGTLKDGKLTVKEIHRFTNGPHNVLGSLHWNILHLYEESIQAIINCVQNENVQPNAIGVDTWGVDYALLNKKGSFLDMPFAYRDSRTDNAIEEFTKIIPKERIYELTGIQFMQFNTLFQLFADKESRPCTLSAATDLLFMPDILNYVLTGQKVTDFSFATTSQLFNPNKMDWEDELLDALGISKSIMQKVVLPGTVIGNMIDNLCLQTGVKKLPVVAVASHDTGSAIAAIPAQGDDWAYISSGTWSLMGIESKHPIINETSYKYNITNEGGVEKTIRVLKNIMGLWLLQRTKAAWDKEKQYTYPELVELAKGAPQFKSFVDPDDSTFLYPENMAVAIHDFCKKTGQPVPANHAETVQCIFQSLAMKYRDTIDQLRDLSKKPLKKLYVTGGGSKNELLNQYIANATGAEVIAALPEGTAVGNIMVQAMAMGDVKDLEEIREVISRSFPLKSFKPENINAWEEAYQNYKKHTK